MSTESSTLLKLWNKLKIVVAPVFNVCKKFLDPLDDFWPAIRQTLPKIPIFTAIGFGLTGLLGIVNGSYEGMRGIIEAIRAFQNRDIGQRKTRIMTGALMALFGAAAFSLGVTLIVAAFGAGVTGAVFLNFLIPSIVATIFGITFWKNVYVWQQAKKQEQKHRDAYKEHIQLQQNDSISEKKTKELENNFKIACTKRLEKEEEAVFKGIETFAMAVVAIGVILGVASLIGLTAASLGLLPVAVILVGATCGAIGKLCEESSTVREFFREQAKKIRKLFSHGKSPTVVPLDVQKAPGMGRGGGTTARLLGEKEWWMQNGGVPGAGNAPTPGAESPVPAAGTPPSSATVTFFSKGAAALGGSIGPSVAQTTASSTLYPGLTNSTS